MSNKRKLTKAEEKRLIIFNQVSEDLISKGYRRVDLIGNHIKANIIGPLYGIIVSLPFIILLILISPDSFIVGDNYSRNYLIAMALMLVFIVIHELIHGITFSSFTEEKFKNIEFGIIWKTLNPYCTCKKPLKEKEYILGLIMPCIILGIIPCVISLINKNAWFLATGVLQIASAGGDLYILKMILDSRNNLDSIYLDHPTDIGLVKFER